MSEASAAEFWEQRYRSKTRTPSGRPGALLSDVAGPLQPGTALELGCAEGDDAIWLARLGWRVTAVDLSATALSRASARAANAGVASRMDFQQHDLAHTFPDGTFDLVSAQYLQSPVEFPRDQVMQRAARAVAPGGLLLVVVHGSAPPWADHDSHERRFPTPAESLAALELRPGSWHVEIADMREREATGPGGETAVLADNVIAARRRVRA